MEHPRLNEVVKPEAVRPGHEELIDKGDAGLELLRAVGSCDQTVTEGDALPAAEGRCPLSIHGPASSFASWSASKRLASTRRPNDRCAMTRPSKNTFARQVTLPVGCALLGASRADDGRDSSCIYALLVVPGRSEGPQRHLYPLNTKINPGDHDSSEQGK